MKSAKMMIEQCTTGVSIATYAVNRDTKHWCIF